jgi:signal transduction histidine kinase
MLEELPLVRSGRPPRVVYALRAIGFIGLAVMVVAAINIEPKPALHGDGLGVLLAVVLLLVGVVLTVQWRPMPPGVRFAGLAAVAIAGALFSAFQPSGAGIGTVYYVFAIAELRMSRRAAVVLSTLALGGQVIGLAIGAENPGGHIAGVVFATVPWFLVLRLMRELRLRGDEAHALVEELRESRAAHAQSAALGERARLARDMHDVLAHSLSALALQLEAARLLAHERDSDPEVVAALERSHRLAASGLDEARRAIAALRGDELPGPERLQALCDAFREHSSADCMVTVTGSAHELESEARLAIYRTAQEALTNIRRHSAADRVEIRLAYAADGTTLLVSDHGRGAPVAVGGGSGYGLTGMRERAELLGGRLRAEPTADGFEVELWLPA